MVFPRDDQNPYQSLLYGEMEQFGTRITYLGCLTSSRTLNVLLLPIEIAVRGATQARLIHLHWVYGFGLPGAGRFPWIKLLAQVWFGLWLRTARMFGVPIVWTAHNTLPHSPVFADDIAARRALVAASDLVLVHSQSALTELAELGVVPRRSVIIPHGPLAPVERSPSWRVPGTGGAPRQFLFFGKILKYKGVEDLLTAFAALPVDVAAHLTVVGQCDDTVMRSRLRALARACGARVTLCLERVAQQDVAPLLTSADVVVLPFRRITTSGSAMLALAYGRPLILPELSALAHLPQEAIFKYNGTQYALTAALTEAALAETSLLADMANAAYAYSALLSWHDIAIQTKTEMDSVLCLGADRVLSAQQ